MDILRITARWSGFSGAPGYSNFHFTTDAGFWDGGLLGDGAEEAANSAAGRVRSAFMGLGSHLPAEVSIAIEPEAVIFNSDTGEALGFADIDVPGLSMQGSSSGYAGPVGAVVNWRTNDYRAGRRIRGRTFLVPLGGNQYENDGTLTEDALDDLREFGATIIGDGADPEFGVWSRPVNGAGGVFATVVASNVPDMAAVLRSRRD